MLVKGNISNIGMVLFFLKKVRDLYSVMFIVLKGEMLLAGKSISRLMNTFMLIAYIAQG